MSARPTLRNIKYRQRPYTAALVTANGVIQALEDVDAIILRNAGTATVELWNGGYTLDSKETVSINVTQDDSTLDFVNVPVTFDTSTGAVKKLQIIYVRSSPCF